MTWLSLLCPSCRPLDLREWLNSLYNNCVDPKSIELSLTLESDLDDYQYERWGNIVITKVVHGQYNINQLTKICYKQSTSPYTFLSGDDTICHSFSWDVIFQSCLKKYLDDIVLVYPNDTIFGENLACYPVTSRLIMDKVFDNFENLVPFERYAIDDTIFDIVPRTRRIYLKHVIMEHMHLREEGPGQPVIKNGKTYYYPHETGPMERDRILYQKLQYERDDIRRKLEIQGGLMNNAKVMLCVPTAEMGRRADFYDYFNALDKPDGTMMTFAHGQSPARNRNIMIRMAIEHEATHCMFIDDDMAFKPDLLKKLLSHDKDIVSGLYLMRNYPHLPVMFDEAYDDGKCKFSFLNDGLNGLVECVNIGLGACLIKTDVFKKMAGSHDLKTFPWITLGEAEADHWCDDISFFNRVRKFGYKIYVDTDCSCGHMMSATIWPNRDVNTGKWYTMYNTGASEMFQVPQTIPSDAEVIRARELAGVSK